MAIALVQTVNNAVGSNVTSQATVLGNTTSGNTIIVAVAYYYSSSPTDVVSTITDSQSNTYTKQVIATSSATGNVEIWKADNITGGTTPTVTITFSIVTTTRPVATIREFSGLNTLSTDVNAATSYNSVTSLSVGPTSVTSVADELIVVSAFMNGSSSITATVGSGYTGLQTVRNTSLTGICNFSEYAIVSSIGAQTGTFTLSAAASGSIAIATFKGVTAAPVTPSTNAFITYTPPFLS